MTKRSAKRGHNVSQKAPPPPPSSSSSEKALWERHAGKLILASGAIAASIAILNYGKPLLNSHLPSASQEDLGKSESGHEAIDANLLQQIKNLDARQTQSIARGEQIAKQLREQAMTSLRADIDRLKDAPDETSRQLRARDMQALKDLEALKDQ